MKNKKSVNLHTGFFIKVFILVMFFTSFNTEVYSQDELKNLPEYSLPLSDKKLVIAHNMTNIIRFKNHRMEDSCEPEYYPPKGNITEPIGGLVQVNVMADKFLADSSLEAAVEFEMLTAKKMGVDGFQFYYPIRQRGPDDEIIKAYFKVATEKNIDFKLTLCPSHPSGLTEEIKIADYAKRINGILDEVGHDNPHWLRTPDGRLIIYLWYGEQLADIPADLAGKTRAYYAARAYKKLGDAIGEKLACVIAFNHEVSKEELNDYLDYFPATWMWTIPYTENYVGKMVADECTRRQRNFTGSTFLEFYTSKLLPPGTWDMYNYAEDAANAGMSKIERRGIITGLSYNYRKLLEFAVEKDVQIINLITWNDYPEGHHLAPEANHNYGFSVLLNHYKSIWKGEPIPTSDRDVAIVFFKKYNHTIKPYPFNVPIVNIGASMDEAFEDSIEVVTILPKAAEVTLNGKTVTVKPGLISTKFEQRPGKVELTISRKGKTTVDFFTPEWITDKPYRTDRLIYSFCSEFARMHYSIFGDFPPVYSREYDKDLKEIILDFPPSENTSMR